MFCTKCGQPAAPDAAFCAKCGNALTNPAQPAQRPLAVPGQGQPGEEWAKKPEYTPSNNIPPQSYYMPQAPPIQVSSLPPVKKKSKGLIVGLASGGILLLAVIAVVLFVWPGLLITAAPVAGVWYSENRGEAIRFGSGSSFDAYTYYGEFDGGYQYDKSNGKGHIEMSDDREFDFVVDQNMLYVEDMGTFDRADAIFDIDGFIDDAKQEYEQDGH